MFAGWMVDASAVETTGSALQALAALRALCGQAEGTRIDQAMPRAVAFLRSEQRPDGSFAGTWGINYTYATFFAVRGLRATGLARDDHCLERAARWLLAVQRADGGWGEDPRSCHEHSYLQHERSLPEMTSWAVLAAVEILPPGHADVARGIAWLCREQAADGSWPAGQANGVFFETGVLTYRLYPAYFPIWALGRYLDTIERATP